MTSDIRIRGVNYPALWGPVIGNSWRTTNDISASYWSMINNLDNNNPWADFAAPGAWNDPDNLEVNHSQTHRGLPLHTHFHYSYASTIELG